MMMNCIQSDNIFYKKTRVLFDLILWMQDSEKGVTIDDIMKRFAVSKRTAIRMKDSVKTQFPQVIEKTSAHNKKYWYIPKEAVEDYVNSSFLNFDLLRSVNSKQHEKKSFAGKIMAKVKEYIHNEEQHIAPAEITGKTQRVDTSQNSSIACLKKNDYMLDNLIKLNKELNTQDKIKMILLLAKKQGYDKLTARQLVIAYYERYTMKSEGRRDFQNLTQMREELSKISSCYKELIDFND